MPEDAKNQFDAIEVKVDVSDSVKESKVDVIAERDKAKKEEKARISEIMMIAEHYKMKELGEQYVNDGKSVDSFRAAVLDKIPVHDFEGKTGEIGMSQKESGEFSFRRAILGLVNGDMKKYAPYEMECSDAVGKKLGREAQGFFIPDDVLRRDLTVGTPTSPSTGGGNLVATNLLAGSFIELLYKRMVVKALGARTLTGLVGDVLIPKMSGGATTYWVSENTAITAESAQTFTQLSMRPKTLGAYTDMSRKLLIQSSMDVEMLIRNDMATQIALAIDKAALMGSGTGAIPKGILNYSGIGDVASDGTALEYANIVELWTDVATENADFGSLGFVCNAKLAGKLMQTYPNTTGGDTPVWIGGPGDGTMLGFRAMVSNQIPNTFTSDGSSSGGTLTAIVFGNWNDLILGMWSGVDVLVDPYTGGTAGTVRVIMLQDMDVQIRHAESFSASQDVATA